MGDIGNDGSTEEGSDVERRRRENHDGRNDKSKAAAQGAADDVFKRSDQQ